MRESNPQLTITNGLLYHLTNPAAGRQNASANITVSCGKSNHKKRPPTRLHLVKPYQDRANGKTSEVARLQNNYSRSKGVTFSGCCHLNPANCPQEGQWLYQGSWRLLQTPHCQPKFTVLAA